MEFTTWFNGSQRNLMDFNDFLENLNWIQLNSKKKFSVIQWRSQEFSGIERNSVEFKSKQFKRYSCCCGFKRIQQNSIEFNRTHEIKWNWMESSRIQCNLSMYRCDPIRISI